MFNGLLEPFGLHAMQRFVFYERPQTVAVSDACGTQLGVSDDEKGEATYTSVGELYSLIRQGFAAISEDELFIGRKDRQVGRDLVDFPDIVKVVDRESAFAAIDMIVEQGEGNPGDPVNSHYGAFIQVLEEFELERNAAGDSFVPARPAATNPISRDRGGYG